MKYKIPRNIKGGLSFAGLQFIGWLLFLPSAAMMLMISYYTFHYLSAQAAIMIALIGIGLLYYCYQMDEKSGSMNISWLIERIRWSKEPKIIEPVWGDEYDKFRSLSIQFVRKQEKGNSKTRNSN